MAYDNKADYSKDKKKYSSNVMDYDPNVGENQMHFSGNSEGGRSAMVSDSVGVVGGLSALDTIEVKNAEMVCVNQRPKGRTESDGPFTIGIA